MSNFYHKCNLPNKIIKLMGAMENGKVDSV